MNSGGVGLVGLRGGISPVMGANVFFFSGIKAGGGILGGGGRSIVGGFDLSIGDEGGGPEQEWTV